MDRGFEQFILAAIILLAGLVDWVVRSLKNRSASQEGQPTIQHGEADIVPEGNDDERWSDPRDAEWEPPVRPIPERPAAPVPSRPLPATVAVFTVPQTPPQPAAARPVLTAAPARRQRRNRWVNDAGDARRGIVLLEILKPCKGLEPPRRRG